MSAVMFENYAADRAEMSVGAFLTTFFGCSAILAVWVDFRLGERSPQSVQKVILHGGCSLLAMYIVTAVASSLMSPDAKAQTVLALFLILLPGLIYAFLASIWFLKLVRAALPR